MDDLKNVRKRIRNRRYNIEENVHRSFSLFKMLYHGVLLLMCACVLVLAFLLNQKLHIVKLPSAIQNFQVGSVANWLPFEKWFSLKDERVSSTSAYKLLENNKYTNGTNTANALMDGVVLHVQKNADAKSSVSVKQDNGVVSTFANLNDVQVKENERILKDKPMGTYTSYITIDFLKENKKIDLSTAMLSN